MPLDMEPRGQFRVKHLSFQSPRVIPVGITASLIRAMLRVMVRREMWVRLKVKILSDGFSFAKPAFPPQILSHRITEWIGRDLKGHPVPAVLPWEGTPSTRPAFKGKLE